MWLVLVIQRLLLLLQLFYPLTNGVAGINIGIPMHDKIFEPVREITNQRTNGPIKGGGGAGPFSVTCDWPFLKSVICVKAKFNSVICDRGIFCDV